MLVDNKDGTVTDTFTNLMWKQDIETGTYSWEKARKITSDFIDYKDWRLPTIKELLSIIDYERYAPAIDTTYFPNTSSSYFWSSSPSADYTHSAWGVSFGNGDADNHSRSNGLCVRLVRNIYS